MKCPGLPWTAVQDAPWPKVLGIGTIELCVKAYPPTWKDGHFSKSHKDGIRVSPGR